MRDEREERISKGRIVWPESEEKRYREGGEEEGGEMGGFSCHYTNIHHYAHI